MPATRRATAAEWWRTAADSAGDNKAVAQAKPRRFDAAIATLEDPSLGTDPEARRLLAVGPVFLDRSTGPVGDSAVTGFTTMVCADPGRVDPAR